MPKIWSPRIIRAALDRPSSGCSFLYGLKPLKGQQHPVTADIPVVALVLHPRSSAMLFPVEEATEDQSVKLFQA